MSEVRDNSISSGRRLNHAEFVHRPGESHLVVELFEALGCSCFQVDAPPFGNYVVVQLDGSPNGENDIFVSEAEPEQLALEDALRHQMESGESELATASDGFRRLQKERPYRTTHIGIRIPTVVDLDRVIERLDLLAARTPGQRLALGETLSRGEAEAREMSAPLKQIWIWTDLISTGLLTVGQQIELQAYKFS